MPTYLRSTILLILLIDFLPSVALAETVTPPSDSGMPLMVIAYAVLWLLIAIYLGIIFKRQRKVESEIVFLRQKIDKELGINDDEEASD